MGIKDLWSILSPVGEECPLWTLTGRTLAIDLSGWIVETQNITYKHNLQYLKLLYFRASVLVRLGIKLVFVLDGRVPDLKQGTVGQRIGNSGQVRVRSRLNALASQCKKLLDAMGIPVVQSQGEAEALCAWLNMHGLVDGCVTEDSDAFLYGATTVYRDLSAVEGNPKAICYRAKDIQEKLGLDRQRLVALALFLGCDYHPNGVSGVGKDLALRLLTEDLASNTDVIQRLCSWRVDPFFFMAELGLGQKMGPHCSACQHLGYKKDHNKNGCSVSLCSCPGPGCSLPGACPCDFHLAQIPLERFALECTIRNKALIDAEFPHGGVIEEFLGDHEPHHIPPDAFVWSPPSPSMLMEFLSCRLSWKQDYSSEKVVDLLTRWQMLSERSSGSEFLHPVRINKECVKKGVRCFQITWEPGGELSFVEGEVMTVEPQELFLRKHQYVVQTFFSEQEAKKKNKTRSKGRKKMGKVQENADPTRDIRSYFSQLSITAEDKSEPLSTERASHPDRDPSLLNDSAIWLDFVHVETEFKTDFEPQLPLSDAHIEDSEASSNLSVATEDLLHNFSYMETSSVSLTAVANPHEISCIIDEIVSRK